MTTLRLQLKQPENLGFEYCITCNAILAVVGSFKDLDAVAGLTICYCKIGWCRQDVDYIVKFSYLLDFVADISALVKSLRKAA